MSPQESDFTPVHPLSIPLALHLFIHYICPAPIIHCICARSITFLWGDNCICAWSITFVWGALHGSSVYPTLHQEWTLNKHTLLAAVFHQYIPINHHPQSIIIRSGQYSKPSFKKRVIRLLRSSQISSILKLILASSFHHFGKSFALLSIYTSEKLYFPKLFVFVVRHR